MVLNKDSIVKSIVFCWKYFLMMKSQWHEFSDRAIMILLQIIFYQGTLMQHLKLKWCLTKAQLSNGSLTCRQFKERWTLYHCLYKDKSRNICLWLISLVFTCSEQKKKYLQATLLRHQSKSLMRFWIVSSCRLALLFIFNSLNWFIICLFFAAFSL